MTQTSTPHTTSLAEVLQSVGVELKRVGDREITGKCPVHIRTVGREDRSPSWSINANTGLWICFSCGARGTLSSLLAELTGIEAGLEIQKFLVSTNFNNLTLPKQGEESVYVDRDAFFRFDRVSDTKCSFKNLDPDLVHRYGVRWNPKSKAWAIPIMSATGRLDGWQEKKTGWVRNFPVGVEKGKTLFGIERFRSRTAILVESPLDIIRFAGVFEKPQALATFGAQVSKDQMHLVTHVADRVIVAMDNDEAGIESSKKLYKFMNRPRKGLLWWNYDGTSAKDIGDMTDEEIESGFKTATVIPPWVKNV